MNYRNTTNRMFTWGKCKVLKENLNFQYKLNAATIEIIVASNEIGTLKIQKDKIEKELISLKYKVNAEHWNAINRLIKPSIDWLSHQCVVCIDCIVVANNHGMSSWFNLQIVKNSIILLALKPQEKQLRVKSCNYSSTLLMIHSACYLSRIVPPFIDQGTVDNV